MIKSSKDRAAHADAVAEKAAAELGVASDSRGALEVCGPAMTLEEAVTLGARLDSANLPHRGRSADMTRAHLAAHAHRLVLVFLHYSRLSGVSTMKEATRFRLVGLQQLVSSPAAAASAASAAAAAAAASASPGCCSACGARGT